MKKNYCIIVVLLLMSHFGLQAQSINLQQPVAVPGFFYPGTINFTASAQGIASPEPDYLRVQHLATGWKKLKLGNNPNTIYGPAVNVLSGGNHQLEITLKDLGGNCNWSAVRIRPMAIGEINLAPYIAAAGGASASGWTKITIPLSDFSTDIDFASLAYMEFPYAAGASPFDIAVSEIVFSGGATPFLYFGEGKTDNIHDGTGSGASLLASVVNASQPTIYIQKVDFYESSTLIGSDVTPPYNLSWATPAAGNYSVSAHLITNQGIEYISNVIPFQIEVPPPTPLSIVISAPAAGQSYEAPANVAITAATSGLSPAETDYLDVICDGGGYRKLKLGYSNFSVYGPPVNTVTDGNTQLEITLRDFSGNTDWSRVLIKPQGFGNISLAPYIEAAGGSSGDWMKIVIPLSAFPAEAPFNNLANFEFPYSANAGAFHLGIRSIEFTGGTTPFTWFGNEKTDNKHDGSTSPYGLQASVIEVIPGADYIEKVEFWTGQTLLSTDFSVPFTYNWVLEQPGDYTVYSKAIAHLGSTAYSASIPVVVTEPEIPSSPLSVSITSPAAQSLHYSPLNLNIQAGVQGIVLPGDDYLKAVNIQTGFRKLKLGYTSTAVYGAQQNVVAGGNDTLTIVLKDIGGTAAWESIRIRPDATGTLNLQPYVNAARQLENGWMELKIPLADFDASIDFSSLQLFEFPYSAAAPAFELGIRLIKFTGGTSPFVWFGEGKTDNAHDGGSGSSSMQATVIDGNAGVVTVNKVEFYDHATLVGTDMTAPFETMYQDVPTGNRKLTAKVFDSNGLNSISDTCLITVEQFQPGNALVLTVTFDQAPTYVNIHKAPLRYNKDFAWSFTLDDGYKCGYDRAFPLISGGYSAATGETYPGFHYTDGCGNDIPFSGGLSWYSVNSLGTDIHNTSVNYINYSELPPMINAGWRVFNHTYSHSAYSGANYYHEIRANDSTLRLKAGYRTNIFVVPSGDTNYLQYAYNYGLLASFGNNNNYQGYPYGLDVDQAINTNHLSVYKRFLQDPWYDTTTIANPLKQAANLSVNGNHLWYNDFTHRVTGGNGNLSFNTLKHYMEQAEALYGKTGTDRMWMAPLQSVMEYLLVRDNSIINFNRQGNLMPVAIDRTGVPDSLLEYTLSLLIESDANITSIVGNQPVSMTFQPNGLSKLVNLKWLDGNLKNRAGEQAVHQTQKPALYLIPNPVESFTTLWIEHLDGPAAVTLFAIDGQPTDRRSVIFTGGKAHYQLPQKTAHGLYFLKVTLPNGEEVTQKLLKN